jgi:hypothetical protein
MRYLLDMARPARGTRQGWAEWLSRLWRTIPFHLVADVRGVVDMWG